MIQRLAVIGLGLIGGSLARAARERGLVAQVAAFDPDARQLRDGGEAGFVDLAATSIAEAVDGAGLIVVAVPVAASREVFEALAPLELGAAIITDVGSTKGSVLADAEAAFGRLPAQLVAGHPIAGTERSGAANARADLFVGRRVILTPHPGNPAETVARVRDFWHGLGASVVEMDATRHDRVLAATSHLPHLLAYALVDRLATLDAREEIFAFAAGGFRDFTRIASSSPRMWHDIAFANREALLDALDGFAEQLQRLRAALADEDHAGVLDCFTRARAAREQFLALIETPATEQS